MRATVPLLMLTLALAGCGRLGDSMGDSSMNPLRWFGGGGDNTPTTLDPKGGFADLADARPGVALITGARWEPLSEGRLLVVTARTPTKGYWRPAIVAENPDPTGRLRPDEDGVLRLRFVAWPPYEGSEASRLAAGPQDTITAAVALSHNTVGAVREVVVTGAQNAITIRN